MAVSCCLCRKELQDSSSLKKKKLFNCESCKTSREFLNELALELFQSSISSFRETSDVKAYLCHHCDQYATNFYKHENEIKKIKEEVKSKVSKLTNLLNAPTLSTVPCGAKRTSADAMLDEDDDTTSEPSTSSDQRVSVCISCVYEAVHIHNYI